jgi:hypothetical protein
MRNITRSVNPGEDQHTQQGRTCRAGALKAGYQAAVAQLQGKFERQLREMELRVHAHHAEGSAKGPVAQLQAHVERLQRDNKALQARCWSARLA